MARLRSIHVLLLLALGTLPLAPAEHAHEVAGSDGQQFLVHRHAEGHDGAHAATPHSHDALIDHAGVPLLTAAPVFTIPTTADIQAPLATVAVTHGAPASPSLLVQARLHSPVPIHGPPRAPAPQRGPPASPTL